MNRLALLIAILKTNALVIDEQPLFLQSINQEQELRSSSRSSSSSSSSRSSSRITTKSSSYSQKRIENNY